MSVGLQRRDLLRGRMARPPVAPVPRPPGAVAEELFARSCDGCAACAFACPEKVIRLDADHRPILSFRHGECTFCDACAKACPTGAIVVEGGRPWTMLAEISGRCIAVGGVHCRSCGDACPTSAALRFVPLADGRFLPLVDEAACTGCGACVAPCPVDAITVAPASVSARSASEGVPA